MVGRGPNGKGGERMKGRYYVLDGGEEREVESTYFDSFTRDGEGPCISGIVVIGLRQSIESR